MLAESRVMCLCSFCNRGFVGFRAELTASLTRPPVAAIASELVNVWVQRKQVTSSDYHVVQTGNNAITNAVTRVQVSGFSGSSK